MRIRGLIIGLGMGALGASGISANAADLTPIAKTPAIAVYNWTGFYVGANAGGSAGVSDVRQSTFLGANPDVSNSSTHTPFGAIGGLQAGYNWQAGRIVLGVEADIQASGQKSSESCLTFCELPAQFDKVSQSLPWFATARGRIGYAAGSVLFFGTAGVAFADIKTNYNTNNDGNLVGSATRSRTGWTAGGGIEAALSGNWTAKIEYLYLDFGNVGATFVYPDNFGGGFIVTTTVNSSVRDHIVRFGLNYRFGDAVAPAYVASTGMVTKAPALVPPAGYNWSGFYVGANLGYSVGRDDTSRLALGLFGTGVEREQMDMVPRGVIGGGQAGYNWQFGNFVAGLEGDYQAADQNDTAIFNWVRPTIYSSITQKLNWFATGRGRLGYASGPALFYATGGGAVAEIKTSASIVNGADVSGGSFNNTRTGWVVGAGIEGALGSNWTAKVEYLYMDLGTFTNLFPGAPALVNLADPNVRLTSHVTDNIFRVGLNYHFNPNPVVAKY